MGLFNKKSCSICGGDIGLLGNRKLADGNMCKNCAAKLSPFFSERKSSTVDEINEQLAYREENKQAVASFNTTRSFGENMKLLLDEDARKFVVTRARNLVEANPDVIDFAQVTGVDIIPDEHKSEKKFKNKENKEVSYNPPRFEYSYDFDVLIRVNTPYFDEIRFQLNPSAIELNPDSPVIAAKAPNPRLNAEYKRYENMGNEIKRALTQARQQAREEIEAANTPKGPVSCPFCGATTVPNQRGCCEFCGSAII